MAKNSRGRDNARPGGVEIQKGPINLDEQFMSGFRREPEMTREDIKNMEGRRDGQILTLHTPKR